MTPEQEHELIQQAREDRRAFLHLYDHYFPRVQAYVRHGVQSTQGAEDIIAEAFFKAVRNLDSFRWRHRGSFAAWLFRIAHNLIVDYYRQHKRTALSLESDENLAEVRSRAPLPAQVVAQREAFRQVRALIATLSPRRQEVITLKFFGGLCNCEVADILALDERTIASHLSRGLRDLEHGYAAQGQPEVTLEVAA
jgi:RNA polymerase sigma-70 factor (ECF subfamily)